jgi:Spy/CpxP family protein refolding chaperone
MILALTVGAFAQRGRALPGAQGQRPGPINALKDALNLTDAQVSAIQSVVQSSQDQSKAMMSDLNQKRQLLNSLLNAASPNPTDVGNAALAVHAGEAQLQTLRKNQLASIRNTLTSDQQVTFDTLVKAGLPIPGIGGGPGFGGPRGRRVPGA